MSDVSATKMKTHSPTRQVAVGIAGGLVVLIGIAMIILPGPAFIVIPMGLAILASEFEWARKWLQKTREYIREKFHRKREQKLS
ncbi:MAG: integral rane protein TerC [Verrucomicrobiales bacterium]|nr:integral rane protein TerC [Verrucomicrobiales bacterium]